MNVSYVVYVEALPTIACPINLNKTLKQNKHLMAMIVAQLIPRLFPIPEGQGSNTVIVNFYKTFYCYLFVKKDEK